MSNSDHFYEAQELYKTEDREVSETHVRYDSPQKLSTSPEKAEKKTKKKKEN